MAMAKLKVLTEMLQSWAIPWLMMLLSVFCLVVTFSRLLVAGDFRTLLSWSRFQTAWFAYVWAWVGPEIRSGGEENVVPLLEGRIRGGLIVPRGDNHATGVVGTVLEVGPGSGNWVSQFSDRGLTDDNNDNDQQGRHGVTRVIGVEPNVGLHPALRASIAEAGLQDVYEILPIGIEGLEATGRVQRESVDCVVSILCLCGVPDPRRTIKELYGYLKPGGKFFVFEHVKCSPTRSGRAVSVYQGLVNIVWPYLMGGCDLRRETDKWLREAGPWNEIDLAGPSVQPWFASIPHVIGVLTK